MTCPKCQPKPSQKVHGLVGMDRFKITCPKWLKGFFDTQNGFFLPKFLVKKIRNSSNATTYISLRYIPKTFK
jgi:hypothetical protein